MNKKIILAVLLVVALVLVFAACTDATYEQSSIGNEAKGKPVYNNGGLVVRQGNYIYFVNARIGADAANGFGDQKTSCLMRTVVNEDGSLSEPVIVVPKNIHSGIYIRGNWIYYTSPNHDKDKKGNVNATYLDIFRTSADGAVTQRLRTIDDRSAKIFASEDCVLVYSRNTLHRIKTGGRKLKKIQDKKNYETVLERVSSVVPVDTDNAFGGNLLVVQDMDEKYLSYRNYNTLLSVDAKGAVKELIGEETYRTGEEKTDSERFAADTRTAVLDVLASGEDVIVYYTSTIVDASGKSRAALKSCRFGGGAFAFDKNNEKVLEKNYKGSSVKGISAGEALVSSSSTPYMHVADGAERDIAATRPARELSVKGIVKIGDTEYIYYTDKASAKILYRFALRAPAGGADDRVEKTVCDLSPDESFLPVETDGHHMYYLDSKTYADSAHYLYRVDLSADKVEPQLVGKMSEEDRKAFEKEKDEKKA